jgi:hypothetical protein
MTRFKKLHLLLLLVVLTGVLAAPIRAEHNIDVVVKTVLASHGAKYFDPRLSSLIKELRSVFRYSSYRLLSQDRINVRMSETGVVSLPGNRILKITPTGVTGNRVELRLVILKKRRVIFETVIQLLNNSSIIVGGPKHKDGSLLFNISASF